MNNTNVPREVRPVVNNWNGEEGLLNIYKVARFLPQSQALWGRQLGKDGLKRIRSLWRLKSMYDTRIEQKHSHQVFQHLNYSIGFSPDQVRPNFWGFKDSERTHARQVQARVNLNHSGCVNAATWDASGQLLATTGDCCTVKTWKYSELKALQSNQTPIDASEDYTTSTLHGNNILDVKFRPEKESEFVTCGLDGKLCLGTIGSSIQRQTQLYQSEMLTAMVEFVPTTWPSGYGDVLYAACPTVGLVCVDLRSPRRSVVLENVDFDVGSLALSDDPIYGSQMMAVCSLTLGVKLYDSRMNTSRPLLQGSEQNISPKHSATMCFSKERRELLVSCMDGDIYTYDIGSWNSTNVNLGNPQTFLTGVYPHCNNSLTFVKKATYFGPREEYVMAGSDNGFVAIWDRRTLRPLGFISADTDIVNGVSPHPHDRTIVTYGIDSYAKLIQVGNDLENNDQNPHAKQSALFHTRASLLIPRGEPRHNEYGSQTEHFIDSFNSHDWVNSPAPWAAAVDLRPETDYIRRLHGMSVFRCLELPQIPGDLPFIAHQVGIFPEFKDTLLSKCRPELQSIYECFRKCCWSIVQRECNADVGFDKEQMKVSLPQVVQVVQYLRDLSKTYFASRNWMVSGNLYHKATIVARDSAMYCDAPHEQKLIVLDLYFRSAISLLTCQLMMHIRNLHESCKLLVDELETGIGPNQITLTDEQVNGLKVKVFLIRGMVSESQRKPDRAVHWYKKVLNLNPTHTTALRKLERYTNQRKQNSADVKLDAKHRRLS